MYFFLCNNLFVGLEKRFFCKPLIRVKEVRYISYPVNKKRSIQRKLLILASCGSDIIMSKED